MVEGEGRLMNGVRMKQIITLLHREKRIFETKNQLNNSYKLQAWS